MAHIPIDGDETIELENIEWPMPVREAFPRSLSGAIEYNLTYAVWWVLSTLDVPIIMLGSWTGRVFMRIFEKSAGPYVKPMIDAYLEVADPDDPIAKMLRMGLNPEGIAWGAIGVGLGTQAGAAGLMSVFEPIFEQARQNAYIKHPTKIFDPGTILGAKWRGGLDPTRYSEFMQRHGFDIPLHSIIEETVRPRLPEDQLAQWYLRDQSRESKFTEELGKRGYDDDEIDKVLELLEVIPAPVDQIRMAVREAFDDNIVKEYQLDSDMHKVPFETLAKVGLNEYWAERYWYAHWVLPSVMQGYQMLHRGEIDEGELETLMKSLDIMPGWIPKLIAISYRPYTRVDVRRMFGMDVLNEQGVLDSYKAIGYDDEKAGKMTEFTLKYFIEDEREETKTDILSAYFEGVVTRDLADELLGDIGYQELYRETYLSATDYRIEQRAKKDEKDGVEEEITREREATKGDILTYYLDGGLDEGEARAFLAEIDYPVSVIDLLIAKTDFRRLQRLIAEAIKTTRILYINEEIDLVDVHERLGKYALPATQLEELLLVWGLERERRTERPSKGELLSWYINDVIDDPELRLQLSKHKFSPEYIDLYVANSDRIILERATAELEREQKEEERLDKAEFRTDRMLAVAHINVQIAAYRVVIAELKVIMVVIVPPGTKDQLRTQIRVKEEEVASLVVTIAARKLQIAEAIETVPTLVDPGDIADVKAEILTLQTQIAGVALEIAELREEIASIRTELSKMVEPDERLDYLEQIALATQAISELQLEKAQLPVVYIPTEE